MMKGKGFSEVINMSGGIKAWNGHTAMGDETLGLDLFSGKETPQDALVVAFSLEAGLQEFYETMTPKVNSESARSLFAKLASIEVKHQQRILEEYNTLTNSLLALDEFAQKIVAPAMEGGLTTEEYLDIYKPDLEVAEEVISLAMAIEAQALDLYQRAAEQAENEDSRLVLTQIANEENAHLEQLGKLFETL